MSNCGRITENILLNCDIPLVGGIKDIMKLINFSDIQGYTRNILNTQIIEGITLITSPQAQAYTVEGKNNSNDVKSTLVKKKYSEGYDHDLLYRVFTNGPDIKKQLEAKAKGRFVAVIENNFKGVNGEAAYEILGLELGLELVEMVSDKSDSETQGAYVLTMRTPELYKEPHLPATFFLTDYSTTKALFNAL
jgi:hypothetical protein